MNDLSSDQHAIIHRQLRRLRRLIVASVCLNGLVLFLLILGAVLRHHHRHHHMRHGDFGGGSNREDFSPPGAPGGFHHHRFMDRGNWDQRGGPDRFGDGNEGSGFDHQPPPDRQDFDHHDFGDHRGPDFGGPGGDEDHGGFGGHSMMGPGTPPDPARMTDGILAHLTQKLSLTADEQTKIKPIIADQVADFQKEAEAHRQDMQKQMADAKAKIRPLLTADQQKQLDALPVPGEKAADSAPPAK